MRRKPHFFAQNIVGFLQREINVFTGFYHGEKREQRNDLKANKEIAHITCPKCQTTS